MQIATTAEGATVVTLKPAETRLLATALERALFLDTPPHLQGATMDFAERLLRALGDHPLATDQ